MTLRNLAKAIIAMAVIAYIALKVTDLDREGSYWQGAGFVVALVVAALLFGLDVSRKKDK